MNNSSVFYRMMHYINLDDCSKSAESCPVVDLLFEYDRFEEQISQLDSLAKARREVFANFVTACVVGNCPGQNPELTAQIMSELGQS